MHGHDGTELPRLSCAAVEGRHGPSNNMIIFSTHQDYRAGCWYDTYDTYVSKYICEGLA